jgi:xanthine dehydrogenase accessory factor
MTHVRDVLSAVLELLSQRRRGALATVVRVSGSAPQTAGARLLLRADDSTLGTVGGGAIERDVLEALKRVRGSEQPELLARDLAHDLGMCCGGRMEIFLEPLVPPPRLWLLGAGHVAKPTAALALTVGFEVHVVDEREELNTVERFPGCQLRLDDPSDVLGRVEVDERDWVVIVTHDHQLDERALSSASATSARYVGLVGSRRKVLRLVERIAVRREVDVPVERLYAPIGLDIGAVSPEEIAVSIVAELVALRHGKSANHLRVLSETQLVETARREVT